jgi:hypothetical protein
MKPQIAQRVRAWLCWLLPLLAAVGGCRHSVTVGGKVSFQGRPVSYGSVIFVVDGRLARSGVIQPDGSYVVEELSAGTAKIAVISRDPSKGRSVLRGGKPSEPGKKETSAHNATPLPWFPLPAKFEDPETSGLTCILGTGHLDYDLLLE